MIAPSLLSYTLAEVEQKCLKIRSNQDRFRLLSHQTTERVVLHCDIVMPKFAKLRSIKASTQYTHTLETVRSVFASEILLLQMHIMGETDEAHALIRSIVLQPDVEYFVPQTLFTDTLHPWFDVHQWSEAGIKKESLLMLVPAGKGGQKKDGALFELAKKAALSMPNLTLDGGLMLDDDIPKSTVVVGSDFWQTF